MTESEPAVPPPKNPGRFLPWGVLGGAILVPFLVFLAMQIVNYTVFECRNGGAEDSLSCVLRTLAITALAIPVGAVTGFFVAYWAGKRRQ
jgi:hypothetical protein